MQVTPEDLNTMSRLVYELCGIVLDQTKGYLVESRLSRAVEAAGCGGFGEFARKARAAADATLRNIIIDAITTQETHFFRDNSPFDVLQHKVLPDLIDAKSRTVLAETIAAMVCRVQHWPGTLQPGHDPLRVDP